MAALDGPVFLLSDFRSGSTLLRYALDTHPDLCCPAELGIAQFCQEVFRVVELTTEQDGETEDRYARRGAQVRHIIDLLMNDYCKRKGKRRWCEKSPSNTNFLRVLDFVFPDASYICLFRHGLDQVYSFLELDDENRLEGYLWRYGGNLVAAGIDRWCTQAEKLMAFEHLRQDRCARVHYERFVASPETELARLMAFLGLPVVENLSGRSFEIRHDRGPADAKIRSSTAVDPGRVGKGQYLDVTSLPLALKDRFEGILASLGYSSRSGTEASESLHSGPD